MSGISGSLVQFTGCRENVAMTSTVDTVLLAVHCANWQLGGLRGAATRLDLKRTTRSYKMRRLGIVPPAEGAQV
jgi:hypothetical protein